MIRVEQANGWEISYKGVTAPVICDILIRANAERLLSNHVHQLYDRC